jgi:16S rRNA (guanine966-N2)-methyltransferase
MQKNKVRIISGKYRGRKIAFNPDLSLRPTPDRVKETLFNWLSPKIIGAKCLDLFAGSGALAIEAISRGAELAVAIEKNPIAIKKLQENQAVLGINNLQILHTDGISYVAQKNKISFDIIFLDPPYNNDILVITLNEIIKNNILSFDGLIYFESNQQDIEEKIPTELCIVKQKKAGQVNFYLVQFICKT